MSTGSTIDLYAVAGTHRPATTSAISDSRIDFCLVPVGTGEPSVGISGDSFIHYMIKHINIKVAEYVAECHRVLQKSGLTFKVCFLNRSEDDP